jgi:hypothetical protein
MRFRRAVSDIAWEAVDNVLEHGAGHPRKEYEAERLELARRFQVKYGSGDGSDSKARYPKSIDLETIIMPQSTTASATTSGVRRAASGSTLAARVFARRTK